MQTAKPASPCVSGMFAPALIGKLPKQIGWADVVHLTGVYNFPTFPTLLTARVQHKPLVWSPRGTLQRWEGSRRVLYKSLWEATCRLLLPENIVLHVTSDEEASESSPRMGNKPCSCIPNAVAIPDVAPPHVSDGLLKLLFIGRLDPKKGIENLIAAVSQLSRKGFTEWRLRVAGNGDSKYESSLRALVAEAGLQSKIEFIGHVDNAKKYDAFAWADVVVAPSFTENFGIVVAEALAHARPVIASRGMPWNQVEERQCGAWIPNDPESLAAGIEDARSWDRDAMGRRGRAWMSESFSWRGRAQDMLNLYEQMLSGAGALRRSSHPIPTGQQGPSKCL